MTKFMIQYKTVIVSAARFYVCSENFYVLATEQKKKHLNIPLSVKQESCKDDLLHISASELASADLHVGV